VNPATGLPFAENRIPPSMIDTAAAGLLSYIPEPNLSGSTQNFHNVTTNKNNANDVNLRIIHTFGSAPQAGERGQRGRGGRGGLGAPGGRGGRGGFGRGGRSTLSAGIQYRAQSNTSNNPFPAAGGSNTSGGLNVPVNYSRSIGPVSSNTNFSYNRNRTTAANLFSNKRNIAAELGITGVSGDPLDWGLPTLTFTNYSSLSDSRPSQRLNHAYSIGENLGWFRGNHNLRFGGNFRYNRLASHTGTNARGTFTFNGAATGYDFADFLLGLPQLTSIQYGSATYRFSGNAWGLFLQDDWRAHRRLTFNLGLRYDYASPLTEADNRLVNLDAAPDFSAVAPVQPGNSGPFTGTFPRSLVYPDRNNWAPQIGIAWSPVGRLIVRAGYGISYNNGVYNSMVQQLAFQPPFSVTQTNIASSVPLTLKNGFPTPPPSTVTNNFGVEKDYQVGYAQTWNLSVQRDLPLALIMSADYTGTKGTRLDILQAPNRTAAGLRIP
jgi:outer membrane receptor protein involved in Fe transport